MKTKLSFVFPHPETSIICVSNNDPLGDDPWGYDGYGNSSMNYFRDKRRPEAQQSRPVRMFGTRADMMSFTGVGSGDFWADGIGFDDWNGSFGSNSYRDAINAGFNSWGRDFFTYDDEGERVDIVEKNGQLYKKCEACGEYAGSSEDGTKKYYYNTYELVQSNGGNQEPRWDLNGDGRLSFGEADGWWKWGDGQPVHVRLYKINLGTLSVSDFDNPDFFKEGKPGIYVRFDGDNYVNRDQALVYGTIGLVLVTDNIVMSLGDTYDFDIKKETVQ